MRKISKILEGHTKKYDLSHTIGELKEAMDKINRIKEELSSIEDLDCQDLIEGWNLIDRYYGNITRSKRYSDCDSGIIPNTSVEIIEK